jgi:SAM-dependent methyltransferase
MEAEFDTLAAWTEEAVAELGHDHAIPAACRGSGSPADLTWLAEGLDLHGDRRFLDAGAGIGGPAAWLAEHLGPRGAGTWTGRPVLTDPMPHAVAAARRLFGFPAVAAWSEATPLADDTVDAAWCLGVLCTTTEKRALLGELHRVLRPGGRLGLLVLVARTVPLPESPEGNDFPTDASLEADLAATGFRVDDRIDASELPDAPAWWTERADRVEEAVTRRHRDHPAWHEADAQQQVMGRLIGERHVATVLLRTTAV